MRTHTMVSEAHDQAELVLKYLKENYKPGERINKIDLRIKFSMAYNIGTMVFAILRSKGVPVSIRQIVVPNFRDKSPVVASAQTS